jgi:hypothetical protein
VTGSSLPQAWNEVNFSEDWLSVHPELEVSIRLLREGDEAGVQRAIASPLRTMLSFGIKVCGHCEDAEDATQKVLLKALPHLAKLEDPERAVRLLAGAMVLVSLALVHGSQGIGHGSRLSWG